MSMINEIRAVVPVPRIDAAPRALLVAFFAVSAATGCQRHIFSPPARTVPLEAPRVLAPGETAINVTGSHTDSVFDANVNGGTLGVRRGLTERVEVQAEVSGYHVDADEEPRASISRTAVAGRVGTKVGLYSRHVSAFGGLGGGHHAAGGFLTPDVGLVVGFDNPYFVPFVLGRVGVSQPLGAKTLDLSRTDEPAGTALAKPRLSTYYGFTIGGRVPIEPNGSRVKGGLLGGLAVQEIRDAKDSKSGLGLTLGGEIIFLAEPSHSRGSMKPGDHPDFFRLAPPPGASRESTIRLDRDGRFFHHDGDEDGLVDNPKLAHALHTWIARHPDDGRLILTNGYDWTYFTVDDAPFHVDSVQIADDVLTLGLRNGESYPFEGELREGPEGALYTTVTRKDGVFEARFSRSAQADLSPCLEERAGRVGLALGARFVVPSQR